MPDADHSPWTPAGPRGFSPSPLTLDVEVDVCVVGAGIAGLSTAYLLAREGRSVLVLDDGPIGGGETGRTTAHLASAIDDRYVNLERMHGSDGARLAAESHRAAIDRIEAIAEAEHIACEFLRVDGYLFDPPGTQESILDLELEAALRAGVPGVERRSRAPLGSFDTGPCLRFPRQGQFHPLAYLEGLARAIVRDGGRIATGTHVDAVEGGQPALVRTSTGTVASAKSVVIATNTPFVNVVVMHTKQAAYQTYVIAAPIPRGAVARGLYWDTGDPYHYVRTHAMREREHELLIVGGEDHKTGQAQDGLERFDRLEAWARERFPSLGAVQNRWSGEVLETVDGLAYIGHNPLDGSNVYVITGDSGMGMTHGTIGGMLVTDLICKRSNPWERLYDPARKTLRAAGAFTRENLNVALQYGDWLRGGGTSVEEIAPGHGAVVRRGLGLSAVYRDKEGVLHERSAACPHLGCVVDWNDTEHTWDCPCHGSRFDAWGKVLHGPANTDLRWIADAAPALPSRAERELEQERKLP